MKIYLVGGAVRDKLLNLPVMELDWVVVGSSPKEMLDLGYKQVGKDFPVFLHPQTKEEYALARQERKVASGYHGFKCDANSKITLEEDLLRRDLTINAMAIGDDGSLIDPYGGQKDIDRKLLRHVSEAFVEDPLRLLRLARFAAAYYHLGFKIAFATKKLMRKIVLSGELTTLVKERVWQELEKGLLTNNPEIFFCTLRECGALEQIFPEIDRLFGVPATPGYHPEIDSGVHTLMVLNQAAKLSGKLSIRLGAVLHDLGKGVVSKDIWPSHTNHAEFGCDIIKKLGERYKVPTKLVKFAVLVSKLHIQVHKVSELSSAEIVHTLEQADAFRNPNLFLDLLVVAEADFLGRGFCGDYPDIPWIFPKNCSSKQASYKQAQIWRVILENCLQIKVSDLLIASHSGELIQAELKRQRTNCVKITLESWKQHEK